MKKPLNLALVVLALAVPFGIPAALAIAAWRRRNKPSAKIAEHDVVELLKDQPGTDLVAGRKGTVVAEYGGGQAFAVEFPDGSGNTSCVETLPSDHLRLAWSQQKAA